MTSGGRVSFLTKKRRKETEVEQWCEIFELATELRKFHLDQRFGRVGQLVMNYGLSTSPNVFFNTTDKEIIKNLKKQLKKEVRLLRKQLHRDECL